MGRPFQSSSTSLSEFGKLKNFTSDLLGGQSPSPSMAASLQVEVPGRAASLLLLAALAARVDNFESPIREVQL